jgi:hypothetical protein
VATLDGPEPEICPDCNWPLESCRCDSDEPQNSEDIVDNFHDEMEDR